jgi:TolB protein
LAVSAVIRADLERSGQFRNVDIGGVNPLPNDASQVRFADWKARAADALVLGSVTRGAGGKVEVRYRLLDIPKEQELTAMLYSVAAQRERVAAHRIADDIYEKLTGERGIFSTRIAYVLKQSATAYQLQIADADGLGEQTALRSAEPILSPAWSPDGSKLAYVSLENKKPVIYIHSLVDGKRSVLANFKGSNSAPTWAPDGRRLSVVLSKEGGSAIYDIGADGSNPRRISPGGAIDTEPNFSADGSTIFFTSDRGGSPQIYRMPAGGGEASRLTFEGTYNQSPRASPLGKAIAYVSHSGGRSRVTLLDLASRQTQILTDTARDESPSFSPNGKVILYATEIDGRGVLAAVSSDGQVRQLLTAKAGSVREPAWGPYLPR